MTAYGIQMFSLRDVADTDLDGALKIAAELGYKTIEFAGFKGHTAAEAKAMLEKYNLTLFGTHTGLEELEEDFDGTLAFHKELGNKRFIVPWAPHETKEQLANSIKLINRYQPMLAAEGIEMGYHNHFSEFMPNKDGQIAHNIFEAETNVAFELDTYWVFVAGGDPIAEMNRLKSRLMSIHLRDGNKERVSKALGQGEAPVAAVRARALELGLPMVVESGGCNPTGPEETRRCIEYLRSLES